MLNSRCPLEPEEFADLEAAVTSHRTLEDVVRWGLAHTPPRLVHQVVVQDEFTHDVVIAYRAGFYLVYEST